MIPATSHMTHHAMAKNLSNHCTTAGNAVRPS